MSTFENKQVWSPLTNESPNSKYEKCLNITEEIYKRINITFQIKKLETGVHSEVSDLSDQIDSNELSNETDLFACDKTDSIPSSEPEQQPATNNNNNTAKKTVCVYKRPKKKFRKRVKKRTSTRASDSDASSDEEPLGRARVPSIIILTKDIKPKILSPEECQARKNLKSQEDSKSEQKEKPEVTEEQTGNVTILEKAAILSEEKGGRDRKTCARCSMSFKSERALRRHSVISHSISEEKTRPEREVKPA